MAFTWDDIGGDILDVDDMLERLQELRELRDAEEVAEDETTSAFVMSKEDKQELALLEQFEQYTRGDGGMVQFEGEWYPDTLIRESYFEQYAREQAEDIYSQELSDAKWPFTCIDWEQAAKELNHDYTSVELRPLDENREECDAITYYYRA